MGSFPDALYTPRPRVAAYGGRAVKATLIQRVTGLTSPFKIDCSCGCGGVGAALSSRGNLGFASPSPRQPQSSRHGETYSEPCVRVTSWACGGVCTCGSTQLGASKGFERGLLAKNRGWNRSTTRLHLRKCSHPGLAAIRRGNRRMRRRAREGHGACGFMRARADEASIYMRGGV